MFRRAFHFPRHAAAALLCVAALGLSGSARAGLFDDDEARKAILDLRQKLEQSNEAQRARQAEQMSKLGEQLGKLSEQVARQGEMLSRQTEQTTQLNEQIATLKRSLLDLNSQLELQRADTAKLRGQDEQLARDVAELQRKQKDVAQGVEERIRKIEPQKVSVDDKEFLVDPDEKRQYDEAMAVMRKAEFDKAATALLAFQRRYPASGYASSVQFWLGNAHYARRDYKEAIASFRSLVNAEPDNVRAPEALLAIANCQVELKDAKSARRTIDELTKAYPKSEAAQAGRDRLASLK
jgi:tol-pal system protein YbgF